MINDVYTKSNFIDADFIEKIKNVYLSDRSLMVKRKSETGKEIDLYRIGAAINTPYFGKPGSDVVENYMTKESFLDSVKYNNEMLLKNFSFMYEPLRKKLSDFLGKECDYREDIYLPGIRIFESSAPSSINLTGARGYHFDHTIKDLYLWPMIFDKPITDIISVIICLEIPDSTSFEWIDGTQNNDRAVYTDLKYYTVFEDSTHLTPEMLVNNKEFYYSPGDMVLQWNHVLHRHGKTIFSKPNQRRSTIHVSGMYDGDKIWLTW